jgi:hypothetical protein
MLHQRRLRQAQVPVAVAHQGKIAGATGRSGRQLAGGERAGAGFDRLAHRLVARQHRENLEIVEAEALALGQILEHMACARTLLADAPGDGA